MSTPISTAMNEYIRGQKKAPAKPTAASVIKDLKAVVGGLDPQHLAEFRSAVTAVLDGVDPAATGGGR